MNLHCAAEAVVYGDVTSVCRDRGAPTPWFRFAFFIVLAFFIIPPFGRIFNYFLRQVAASGSPPHSPVKTIRFPV